MQPTTLRRAALALAASVLATSLLAAPGAARESATATVWRKRTTHIAPGLTLTRIVDRRTPLRIFALSVDLPTAMTMDVSLAGPALPGRAPTSQIAGRNGAIAAVNGDFGSRDGIPLESFQQDGRLVRADRPSSMSFAVTKDEQHVHVGPTSQSITATDDSGQSWSIDRWNNGAPGLGEIAASTPVGGIYSPPPAATCSARLLPTAPPILASPDGMLQTFRVDERGCFESALSRDGGVVLSALPATDEALRLLSLAPGSTVTLRWTFGWAGVWDVMGGFPLLVAGGRDAVGDCEARFSASFCAGRSPRTAVGVSAAGQVLMVVVDGRQSKWSVGVGLHAFAHILQRLGATDALNMDGGGSTTMVVRGKVVNRPSNGVQRAVSTAVLVLQGADPGEPT